jgi:hypothetical protein
MKKLILYLLTIIAFTAACSLSDGEPDLNVKANDITIKGGFSFGECYKNCKGSVEIANNKIIYSSFANGSDIPLKQCSANTTAEIITGLSNSINFDAFLNLPAIIGCPDCTDGGAEWIEIGTRGKSHKVTFEYGKPPIELSSLSLFMHSQFSDFKDCQ